MMNRIYIDPRQNQNDKIQSSSMFHSRTLELAWKLFKEFHQLKKSDTSLQPMLTMLAIPEKNQLAGKKILSYLQKAYSRQHSLV